MKAQRMKFILDKLRGDNRVIKPWEEIDSGQQLSILEGVKLGTHEVPVIGIAEGPTRVVITTDRVVWRSGDASSDLNLGEIASIKVPESTESNKLELHRLWLITRAGKEYPLETEPGKPFFVLWNLLIRVIDQPKTVTS